MIGFRDKLAEEWVRSKSASLLGTLRNQWRGTIQQKIVSGLERGQNPRSVGLELAGRVNPQTGLREGGSIELDKSEKETVHLFKRCLTELDQAYFEYGLRDKRYDRSMWRAFRDGVPLMEEKIILLVNRFEAKLLKNKADLVARTEMLAAMNRSEWLSTKAALERSDLPEGAMARIWDSRRDADVRPSHRALDGQRVVGLQQCFVSPLTGAQMMYPGDTALGAPEDEITGCQCQVRYDIDFCYGIK